jgi:hypothetical protein
MSISRRGDGSCGDLPDDLPVFSSGARRGDGRSAHLTSPLGVDPCRRLFGVRRARQTDIGKLGAEITVVTLVDHERVLGDR